MFNSKRDLHNGNARVNAGMLGSPKSLSAKPRQQSPQRESITTGLRIVLQIKSILNQQSKSKSKSKRGLTAQIENLKIGAMWKRTAQRVQSNISNIVLCQSIKNQSKSINQLQGKLKKVNFLFKKMNLMECMD
jgi:hypothetical protein